MRLDSVLVHVNVTGLQCYIEHPVDARALIHCPKTPLLTIQLEIRLAGHAERRTIDGVEQLVVQMLSGPAQKRFATVSKLGVADLYPPQEKTPLRTAGGLILPD